MVYCKQVDTGTVLQPLQAQATYFVQIERNTVTFLR